MKQCFKTIALASLALASLTSVGCAEESVAGKWKGEFDSQIGRQKYTYDFKLDGTNLTGKAIGERAMGTNEVVLTEVKVSKNEITFIEPLKFQDNDIRIEYTGQIKGDEIKFHRKVGDFAEEDFVVRRVPKTGAKPEAESEAEPDAKPAVKVNTNSPSAKP